MDYDAIMEEAIERAAAYANRMYPDPKSKRWKETFEEIKHREYYAMVTPPQPR